MSEKLKIALIPARGGSKRIPRKNIRPFAGKPIIGWAIEAAKKSGLFDKIIVSTDDDEIMGVARAFGAETPFKRPPELADDFTPTDGVLTHALDWVNSKIGPITSFCCIFPTSPFLDPVYLKQGFHEVGIKGEEAAFSMTTFAFPIFRAVKRDDQGHVRMIWPEHTMTRSQDLPEALHDAGQFYWVNYDAYMREKKLWSLKIVPIVLPRTMVQDIDSPEDWAVAEQKMAVLKQDKVAAT